MTYSLRTATKHIVIVACCGFLAACQTSTPPGTVSVGHPNTTPSLYGAAGGAAAINKSPRLTRCVRPIGTLEFALSDTESMDVFKATFNSASDFSDLREYGLQWPNMLLRLYAHQSNCFIIIERYRDLAPSTDERYLDERYLYETGELVDGSNFGTEQIIKADFSLKHQLIISLGDSGRLARSVDNFLVNTFFSFKERDKQTQAFITVNDNRSGEQAFIAEGSARGDHKEASVGVEALSFSGSFAGGYAVTTIEKIIVGAYLDAFNNLVIAAKSYQPQQSVDDEGHGRGGML